MVAMPRRYRVRRVAKWAALVPTVFVLAAIVTYFTLGLLLWPAVELMRQSFNGSNAVSMSYLLPVAIGLVVVLLLLFRSRRKE